MSEVRKWVGLDPAMDSEVKFCPQCQAPVVDTPERWAAHRARVHADRAPLERLPSTKELNRRQPTALRISEDEAILCGPCRHERHLACDGEGCRCTCALELDEKVRRVRPSL